jgi:hypothetical protein
METRTTESEVKASSGRMRDRKDRDLPLEEDLPLRPTLRVGATQDVVVQLSTKVTEVARETTDDR